MSNEFTYYLQLSNNPVRFEPVNQLTNVFFDDSNKQVFAVRSGGVMGVVVKGPTEESKSLNFRMDDCGPVMSIKFSLDQKILAVQRSKNSIEFMNFNGASLDTPYYQSCKKNTDLLGFVWPNINEVALVTKNGVELYSVIPEKKNLKHLKSLSATVQWFVWCPTNKIALLASSQGSQLQPVLFKPASASKMAKAEEPGRILYDRDITLGTLYGTAAVLILRHQNVPQTSEVHVHLLNGSGSSPIKRHVLKLGLSGRFAINIVDDLILVHHQASRSSQVFDINLEGENDGIVTYQKAVAPARSIQPTCLEIPGLLETQKHACELYSADWVVFQPNIVIDAKLGCLWCIHLILPELCKQIQDLSVCTQLALNRTNGKEVLLKLLLDRIDLEEPPPLQQLQSSFNHINVLYRKWIESELQIQSASPAGVQSPSKIVFQPRVLITQADMYERVFQTLDSTDKLRKLEWVLISYITSLTQNDIPAEHSLNEMLINTLVKQEKVSELIQFLQYGVVSDSKPLACRLLSLGHVELALDMFSRLGAKEEIIEILLDQEQVLQALQIAGDKETPRKFLQAAKNTGNSTLFHSTMSALRSNPHFKEMFMKDERLRAYLNYYASLFPVSTKISANSK